MNDEILEKVDDIVSYLKNTDDYKKYIAISESITNNSEIMGLINDVKSLQKEIVKASSVGAITSDLEEEIKTKTDILKTYPIYNELTYVQEDLDNTFQSIRVIIENYINDKTN